jgi:hypothetical protein
MGTLLLPKDPLNGFSNAGCFQQLIDTGNQKVGNLHLTFFGKTLVDPITGTSYTIGSDLFQMIMDNPMGRSIDDPFQISALNHLDILLGEMANDALSDTGDLDAVVSYFGASGSQIQVWTDCLDVSTMLGNTVSGIIKTALGITVLDAYALINALVTNLKGLRNLESMTALGTVMESITPIAGTLSSMTTPVTQSAYANLQATLGPGSGANANPTVSDVLGLTDLNGALSNTITGISSLTNTSEWANISSDTGNVSYVLIHGITGHAYLSNGNAYTDANVFSSDAANLINQQASILANSVVNGNLFSSYNAIAETHNSSILLSSKTGINVANIQSNTLTLMTFPSQLSSMATGDVEVTGLDVLVPLFDSSITGQALNAIVIESQNNSSLNDSGLVSSSNDANSITLYNAPTGNGIVGGGRVS